MITDEQVRRILGRALSEIHDQVRMKYRPGTPPEMVMEEAEGLLVGALTYAAMDESRRRAGG